VTKRIARDPIYRGRRFSAETIELCVRWYITYRLSYRDLAAMLAERGIVVSHTTIMRWVLRYVPEYEVRWARFARSPGSSWRVDETAVNVRGGRYYLYRAVDRQGKSVASFLCNDRSMEAAQAFSANASSDRECLGLAKLISTGTAPLIGPCAYSVRKMPDGEPWRSGRVDISITWSSRTIGPSNGDALRCSDSSHSARRPLLWRVLSSLTEFEKGSTRCNVGMMKGHLRSRSCGMPR
jgi:hypothetical protein